jgi:hypothetical protein
MKLIKWLLRGPEANHGKTCEMYHAGGYRLAHIFKKG